MLGLLAWALLYFTKRPGGPTCQPQHAPGCRELSEAVRKSTGGRRKPMPHVPWYHGTASTGRRRHAPAHHRPQWLWQEFPVPDPWRALAHIWWRALQAPASAHVLHSSKVSSAGEREGSRATSSDPAPSNLWNLTPRRWQSLGPQEETARCCPASNSLLSPYLQKAKVLGTPRVRGCGASTRPLPSPCNLVTLPAVWYACMEVCAHGAGGHVSVYMWCVTVHVSMCMHVCVYACTCL